MATKYISTFAFFSPDAAPTSLDVKRDGTTLLTIAHADAGAAVVTPIHASAVLVYRTVTGGRVWMVTWMTDALETGITLVPSAGDAPLLAQETWTIAEPVRQSDVSAVVGGAIAGFAAALVLNG